MIITTEGKIINFFREEAYSFKDEKNTGSGVINVPTKHFLRFAILEKSNQDENEINTIECTAVLRDNKELIEKTKRIYVDMLINNDFSRIVTLKINMSTWKPQKEKFEGKFILEDIQEIC